MEDLLPCSEHRFCARNRHGQRRPEQRRLQMGVAVAIVPRLLMAVRAAGRNQFVQKLWQVALQTRFELNGADRGRAADVKDVRSAGVNS